jgi:choline dehydrogenase
VTNCYFAIDGALQGLMIFIGTAGCVLAARLTEDPSIRVLLLEAGGRFVFLLARNA